MSSVIVTADWQDTASLDDDGLLTEAEGLRVDSWIRTRTRVQHMHARRGCIHETNGKWNAFIEAAL